MNGSTRIAAGIAAAMALAAAVAAPASASPAPARSQTFIVYGAGTSFDTPSTIIAIGPVSGVGREEIVDDRSGEDTQDFTTRWIFPTGSVTLEVRGTTTTTFDPTSCAGVVTGTIEWTITGGTGAYAGATGGGSGTLVNRFVTQREPGGCSHDDAVFTVFVGRLSGEAAVPGALAA